MALCHISSRVGATDFTSPPRSSAYKLGISIRTAEGPALGLALGAAPHSTHKCVMVEEPAPGRGKHGAPIPL